MDDFLQEPDLPPESFFGMIDSWMTGTRSIAVIMAAMDFQLFDHLRTPGTVPELAAQTGTDPGSLAALCDALVAMHLLERAGEEYRDTTCASLYMDTGSPYCQVHYLQKNATMIKDIWNRLPEVIRSGPVSYEASEFFSRISLRAMADNALCGRLQATIRPIIALPGFFRYRRMIDLGGGHGLYAIALTTHHPLLLADVMDLPPIMPLLQEYIWQYRADRVRAVPGDFFCDPIGSGYDLVFSSSNPSGKSIEMIPKIASALAEKGVFVNVQSHRADHPDPLLSLEWQLWTMDGSRKGGGHYTREQPFLSGEYRQALEEAGLQIIDIREIPDNYHTNTHVTMMIAEKE